MAHLNPYLSFKDNAREAMEFYHSVLGGELTVSRFGDMPESGVAPGEEDLVMHAQINADGGLVLMASDTPTGMNYATPQGMSVSLSGDDPETERLRAAWNGLSEGGTVVMPLDPAPWGGLFGMMVDRFGITWMVAVNPSFA